jgi:protein-tyrosine phosphatase
MAQSPIRIDTDLHGTKRGLSYEATEGYDEQAVPSDQDQAETQITDADSRLPPFLTLPYIGQTVCGCD